MYGILISGKVGHLVQLVTSITYDMEVTRAASPIVENYADTPEDDQRFLRDALVVAAQHLFAILLLLAGIGLLSRNLKWARWLNPIMLTVAFAFELPIY